MEHQHFKDRAQADADRDPRSQPTAFPASSGSPRWPANTPGDLSYSQAYVDSMHRRFEQRLKEKDAKIEFLKRELAAKDDRVAGL